MTASIRAGSLRAAAWLTAALFCCGGAPALAAGPILAGGTGSGSRLLQALADEYQKTGRGAPVRVVDPPLGSGAAIKAVREGRLHLAISARPLEGDEKGANLVQSDFARTPFVFATRDGERSGGFSLVHLADVYRSRLGRWDNGAPIRVILRPSFDADTATIRGMSPALDAAVNHAFDRQGMVTAASDMEALDLIEDTPGSLGPTTLGLVRLRNSAVRVLPLAGKMPSAAALADGSYPWYKALYLVVRRNPPPEVQAFLDFLQSPPARDLLVRTEHLPAAHGK
jgi:phosphate transport system substrate-binding protein